MEIIFNVDKIDATINTYNGIAGNNNWFGVQLTTECAELDCAFCD